MTEVSTTKPAWRFLHVCYCCDDGGKAVEMFVDALDMRNTMNVPMERGSGAILGLGEAESAAHFVYDARGPRTSPAIEVQHWVDPPLVQPPDGDPFRIGIRAIGFRVPDLAGTTAKLVALGSTVLATGPSPFSRTTWTTLADPTGTTLDLIDDPSVPAGETRLAHLRVTTSDRYAASDFYEGLGFYAVGGVVLSSGAFLGIDGPASGHTVRMRLEDEPFELLLIEWTDPPGHGRHYTEPNHAGVFRAALGVDDTRASYEAMQAEGWTFDRAPMAIALNGTPVPEMWICFLSDPDGVPYEFVQRPRGVFRT